MGGFPWILVECLGLWLGYLLCRGPSEGGRRWAIEAFGRLGLGEDFEKTTVIACLFGFSPL